MPKKESYVTIKIKTSTYHELRKHKNVLELVREKKVTVDDLLREALSKLPRYAVAIQEVEPSEKDTE